MMSRCADAFAAEDRSDSRHLKDARELAMADARSALRQAAVRMRAAWGAHTEPGDDPPPGSAMCLSAAANNRVAGRDLLHTHFTTDQFGWRYGTSPWAAAIASRQVSGALVSEIGVSGGPFVTGWITAFFAYIQTEDGPKFKGQFGPGDPFDWRSLTSRGWGGYTTGQFPSHVSKVPFVWDYFGTQYDMAFAAGVTGVDFDDDKFLAPRLGFAVAETPSS